MEEARGSSLHPGKSKPLRSQVRFAREGTLPNHKKGTEGTRQGDTSRPSTRGHSEEGEDEWIDASGSTSPFPSSQRATVVVSDAAASRPGSAVSAEKQGQSQSNKQQHYLTKRMLQRTPSCGAVPPMVTSESVEAAIQSKSVGSVGGGPSSSAEALAKIDALSSGAPRGSVVSPTSQDISPAKDSRHQPGTLSSKGVVQAPPSSAGTMGETDELDDSIHNAASVTSLAHDLVQTSRTQQKLNLQKASVTVEAPRDAAGHDASFLPVDNLASRPARVFERTETEYLIVRRHQNPIAESLARLLQ